MKKQKNIIYLLIIICIILCSFHFNGCKKDFFTANPADKLIFSRDTIHFDTIFTKIGSATKYFIVKNPNKSKSINIDRIYLGKSSQSKYHINVDGQTNSANSFKDKILNPGDSVFIFVMVNIDPDRDQMLELDSIVFVSNGNIQDVKLVSFGQDVILYNETEIISDAYSLYGSIITDNITWTSQKPILIYNNVFIDSLATLTIEEGTKIYFHKNTSLLIKGTLKVNGTENNRVLFTGDRLEPYYRDIAGQWGAYKKNNKGETEAIFGGIHLFPGSKNNKIYNADIYNAIIGIQISDPVITPDISTIHLKNTNIENCQVAGLYALGANIAAENSVFANCGKYTVACIVAGKYSFTHCTMANYWTAGNRKEAQILISDFQMSYSEPIFQTYFGNCIIHGHKDNEIEIDCLKENSQYLSFENCLIRQKDTISFKQNSKADNNIFLNTEVKFKNIKSPYNYQLEKSSPAIDKGNMDISIKLPFDQLGNSRIADEKPDIGAFEYQE